MHVTFAGYLWNIQGIFLYSIFLEHDLRIFHRILYGTFSEYSRNKSWEYSTNIPQKYSYSVGMIDANFESILVPEDNGKQNPNESYINKYQKHIACSYGYKLVCINDKFSTSFKLYLGAKMLFRILLTVSSKKVNVVVM